MNTPDQPTRDPNYRLLRIGEIIQEGDEFFFAFGKEWVTAKATIGLDIDAASKGHYRRAKK